MRANQVQRVCLNARACGEFRAEPGMMQRAMEGVTPTPRVGTRNMRQQIRRDIQDGGKKLSAHVKEQQNDDKAVLLGLNIETFYTVCQIPRQDGEQDFGTVERGKGNHVKDCQQEVELHNDAENAENIV